MMKKLALSVLAVAVLAVSAGSALAVEQRSDYKCLPADSSVIYTETVFAGEVVSVAVAGTNLTDIQLFVYDEFGNLIASDVSYGNNCLVVFVADYTENITIKVVNNSYFANCYGIAVTFA
jgi:hypothetical protein